MFDFNYSWIAGSLKDQKNFSGQSLSALPIYDLASLTKIICTSSLFFEHAINSRDILSFYDQKISLVVSELENTKFDSITIKQCLEHRSGLDAHFLFFDPPRQSFLNDRKKLHQVLLGKILQSNFNEDQNEVYSDIGFTLLMIYLERKSSKSISELWTLWKSNYLDPSNELAFGVDESYQNLVNATECRHSTAEVNDDNCFSMGSQSSHAGLFGSAEDVWQWLESIRKFILKHSELKTALLKNGNRFHLGWDSPSEPYLDSHAGANAAKSVRGHLGYTGTSIWWDMKTELAGVLLSNRVYPEHTEESKLSIKKLRQSFYSQLWDWKEGSTFDFEAPF